MAKPVQKKEPVPPLLLSCRLSYFVMTFLANLIVMLLRSNINFGLVCMVKRPRHGHLVSVNVTETSLLGIVDETLNETSSLLMVTEKQNLSDDSFDYCPALENLNSTAETPMLDGGEFEWDKVVQANLLGAFFYGYVFTNILGGWAADRFGGKKSLIASVGAISFLTLLSPIAALQGEQYLFAVRFLQGVSQGAFLPLLTVLAARWAGANERGFLLGITFGGFNVGIFVINPVSALACKNLGWQYIFYIPGAMGILWCFASYFFIYDWPLEHPRISEAELKQPVPWRSILTAAPINAAHLMHFCVLWGLMTISMVTPQFFKEVLKMDVRRNGMLTSVPFMGMLVVHLFSPSLFDALRRKKVCSVTNLRKIFNTIGALSFVISVPLMSLFSCTENTMEIVSVFLGLSFLEVAFTGGYLFSVFELAPRFTGVISGISNTFGVLPGFLCPAFAALLTPNSTREEWLLVFYISAAIVGFGGAVYLVFGSAELLAWSEPQKFPGNEEAGAEMEELKPVTKTFTNGEAKITEEKPML